MTAFLSFFFRRLPLLWILFTASALVPSAGLAYDAQPQHSVFYDGVSLPTFDYDCAPKPSANKSDSHIIVGVKPGARQNSNH